MQEVYVGSTRVWENEHPYDSYMRSLGPRAYYICDETSGPLKCAINNNADYNLEPLYSLPNLKYNLRPHFNMPGGTCSGTPNNLGVWQSGAPNLLQATNQGQSLCAFVDMPTTTQNFFAYYGLIGGATSEQDGQACRVEGAFGRFTWYVSTTLGSFSPPALNPPADSYFLVWTYPVYPGFSVLPKCYVNGVEQAPVANAALAPNNPDRGYFFRLGGFSGSAGSIGGSGTIFSRVAWFNKELSAAEITELNNRITR